MEISREMRITFAILILLLYTTTFIICRYYLTGYYTPEWTARHFLGIAAIISTIPVCFGWIRYSSIAFVGYLVGILTGEVLGGFQSNVPPQFPHYGWIICIAVFLLFCIAGIALELKRKRRADHLKNHQPG